METVVARDELGRPLQYCYWCKEFESFVPCKIIVGDFEPLDILVCNSCLKERDYYAYLEQVPEISNDY